MEIVFIKDKIRMDAGGGSWSLHLLAENLSQRGHNVDVITVHFSDLDNNITEPHTYKVTEKPLENNARAEAAAKLYKILGDIGKPDILHCFQPELHAVVGARMRKQSDITTVGQINSYESFCTNHAMIQDECYKDCTLQKKWRHHPNPSLGDAPKMAFDTWVQPSLMDSLDLLVPVSPTVKEIFSGYGISKNKLKVLPPMYDETFGSSSTKTNGFSLLYVGRLVDKKGVHLLIDAVERIDIDLTVDIVGTGPELESLRKQSSEEISVHGWVERDRLQKFYEGADVFVHPGLWPEPFGITILEAMQCGCVPIVSNVGGPPWIAGDAGVTFERGDSSKLASKIIELSDPKMRERLRQKISDQLARFDTETTVTKYEQTYFGLLKND